MAFNIAKYPKGKLPLPKAARELFTDKDAGVDEDPVSAATKKKKVSEAWKEHRVFVYNHYKDKWPAKRPSAFTEAAVAAGLSEPQMEVLYLIEKKLTAARDAIYLNFDRSIT